MSTYNGEKYIKTQLESILEQDYREIFLAIRDDGSTDHTVEILKQYEEKYSMEYLWEHLLLCMPMADNGSGGLAGQLPRGGEPFACHDHQQQLFRNIFV